LPYHTADRLRSLASSVKIGGICLPASAYLGRLAPCQSRRSWALGTSRSRALFFSRKTLCRPILRGRPSSRHQLARLRNVRLPGTEGQARLVRLDYKTKARHPPNPSSASLAGAICGERDVRQSATDSERRPDINQARRSSPAISDSRKPKQDSAPGPQIHIPPASKIKRNVPRSTTHLLESKVGGAGCAESRIQQLQEYIRRLSRPGVAGAGGGEQSQKIAQEK